MPSPVPFQFGRFLVSYIRFHTFLLAFLAALGLQQAHAITGTMSSLAADAQPQSDGTIANSTVSYARVGASAGIRQSVVHVFEIPAVVLGDPTQIFSAATYTTKMGSGTPPAANADLYGLTWSTSPMVTIAQHFSGTLDPAATLIHDDFIVPTTPNLTVLTESGAPLVSYLNGALSAARAAGASQAYVFIRLSIDSTVINWGQFLLTMNEAGGTIAPRISFATETASGWQQVPIGGGGLVAGIVGDSTGSLVLARTDVGGIYRWNAQTGSWSNLIDKIHPTTSPGWVYRDLSSVAGIAIDPTDSNKIYAALGAKSGGTIVEDGMGIYRSTDRGDTWSEITNSSFSAFNISGKSLSKGFGERIAVDPNNPSRIWYGSDAKGLIKGELSGTTWTWTQVSSTSVPYGTPSYGVTFVICDDDGGFTTTYAGVYDSSGTTGGVYRSTTGTSWTKTAIAIGRPTRAAIATTGSNAGLLVVTGTPSVFSLTRSGIATDISPVASRFYNGATLTPDGNYIYVSDHLSNIWRKANGGAWITQGVNYNNRNFQYNLTLPAMFPSEPAPDFTPSTLAGNFIPFHAINSLWVNPTNPNELWAADLYRVQRTQQADRFGNSAYDTEPNWYTLEKGFEETFIFDVKNTSANDGLACMTGFADMGGARHLSLNQRPVVISGTSYGSIFTNPPNKDVTSLDFCESEPNFWVRTYTQRGACGTGGFSSDNGATWLRFGQIEQKNMTNAPAGGWETFDLTLYLSKFRARNVTTSTTATLVITADPVRTYKNGGNPEEVLAFESKETPNGASLVPELVLNGTSVYPLADTYVAWQSSGTVPATNYGNAGEINLSNGASTRRFGYLKFSLASASAISSAELRLYRRGTTGNTRSFRVSVHACTNTSWIEGNGGNDNIPAGEITWNNKPAAATDASGDPFESTSPWFSYGSRSLNGGRIAVSSTNSNILVWAPIDGPTFSGTMPIVYSDDRGVTWQNNASNLYTRFASTYTNGTTLDSMAQNLASDRVDGSFYYASYGTPHQFYRSTDGGKTWSARASINAGSNNIFTPQLKAAPAQGHLWVADDSEWQGVHGGGGLWFSDDGAASWTKISTVGRTSAVAFGPPLSTSTAPYAVFALGERSGVRKVYRSDDLGATWVPLADLPTITRIASLYGDRKVPGRVFLGTLGRGLFVGW